MIERIWFVIYCWLFGPRPVLMRGRRSPLWRQVRRAHIKREPTCQWCGARSGLQVHHIEPFHIRPDRELDPSNLITLCGGSENIIARAWRALAGRENCHLKYGHLGNYHASNPQIREDCDAHQSTKARTTRDVGSGDLGAVLLMAFVIWAIPVVMPFFIVGAFVAWVVALCMWPMWTLIITGVVVVPLAIFRVMASRAERCEAESRRGLPGAPAATAALADVAFGLLRKLDSIRRHWLAALAPLLLVVIPAGALLVFGWLWLFERVPTLTLVCTGVIPAIVGGIYVTLRKISAHVI